MKRSLQKVVDKTSYLLVLKLCRVGVRQNIFQKVSVVCNSRPTTTICSGQGPSEFFCAILAKQQLVCTMIWNKWTTMPNPRAK
eukprot:4620142-Amphidinium_carterae.1